MRCYGGLNGIVLDTYWDEWKVNLEKRKHLKTGSDCQATTEMSHRSNQFISLNIVLAFTVYGWAMRAIRMKYVSSHLLMRCAKNSQFSTLQCSLFTFLSRAMKMVGFSCHATTKVSPKLLLFFRNLSLICFLSRPIYFSSVLDKENIFMGSYSKLFSP